MNPLRTTALFAALLLGGCAGQYFRDAGAPPPAPRYSLADLPQPEYWTGVVFNGAKVGFTHTRVAPAAQGLYQIESEAVIHFRFLGYDKRVQMQSLDTVDAEGALRSFDYKYLLDQSEQRVTGEVRDGKLSYRIIGAGQDAGPKEEKLQETVYPAGVLDLLPVLRGLKIGAEYRWLVFDGDTKSLDRATQRVEAYEKSELFEGQAFKVQTDLLGLKSTTWIDARGRPVFELGLNGVMISALEDERTAKSYLASAALNKDDVMVNWSLIKAPLSLKDPRAARYLRIEVLAPAPDRGPLSDERQHCEGKGREFTCEIDAGRTASSAGDSAAALLPSSVVQSNDAMIRTLARKITAGEPTPEQKIAAVLRWLNANIAQEPVDAFSALDVLDAKRGECQGHAYLYTALMRSLGVPTRVVNGLVYSEEYGGFLYHAWAESLVDGGWRAVDPTFGQERADATHIALIRGETLADLVPIVDWVGSTKIRVFEARATR